MSGEFLGGWRDVKSKIKKKWPNDNIDYRNILLYTCNMTVSAIGKQW